MKRVIIVVLCALLAVAYSKGEFDSTLLSQLTEEITEVNNYDNIHNALVLIYDHDDSEVCIGVLTKTGNAIAHRDCLDTIIDPIIKQPSTNKSSCCVYTRVFHFITEIRFQESDSIFENSDARFVDFYWENVKLDDFAQTVEWDEEQGFKLKSVKIVGIVEQWIVVFRRFSNEHERKEKLGDPLFYNNKLVGFLQEAEFEEYHSIYVNVAHGPPVKRECKRSYTYFYYPQRPKLVNKDHFY